MPEAVEFQNLKTVAQLAQLNPAFSEAALRWLIFNSKTNGFDAALVRVGRRVLIDVDRFNQWLSAHRAVPVIPVSASPLARQGR